jgi:hypothetical protein
MTKVDPWRLTRVFASVSKDLHPLHAAQVVATRKLPVAARTVTWARDVERDAFLLS